MSSADSYNIIANYGVYGYTPKLAPAVIFTAVYGMMTILHLYKSITSRQYWTLIIVFGCGFECAGNALRIQGHFNPKDSSINPYIAMQVLVVITPIFFAAAQFAILSKVLQKLGKPLNPFRANWIMIFFIIFDLIALAVQATGSAIAAIAETDGEETRSGSNIIVGGLGVQLFAYVCFDAITIFMLNRLTKALQDRFSQKTKALQDRFSQKTIEEFSPTYVQNLRNGLLTTFISALLILLRSSYRMAEMIKGWIGPIALTEWLYYVFDATPVSLAVIVLFIWHPKGFLYDEDV